MNRNDHNHHEMCQALAELKKLQDFILENKTPYFGNLLARIVDTDTIPFLLQNNEGFLELMGIHHTSSGRKECFFTNFFRIESINTKLCCATISLLMPIDIEGNVTDSICDVIILKRTSTCREIDLSCICAIQVVDTSFLKRKIIIQPKW